ncbi:GIY-YIG nuclease family protein [Acinetobacter wuhouensis]|uniref:GIY-YIG nuclease family protein n=1 Tax=Acinetobacter wuhouensis TaxID=1879050 RepID=A0A3G2T2E4_9GAMM|nr:GIY-YIG nuclease family protein [Acinetobacter wuhouensis]AYO54420.1 GIY-YIG nuclease family protein [Acinetobacter wuhouensis]
MSNNQGVFGDYSEKALTIGMCKLVTQKTLSLLQYYTAQYIDFYKIVNPYANSKILDNLSVKIFDDLTEIGMINGIDKLIDTILREHLFYYKIKPTNLSTALFGDFSEKSIVTAVTQIIDSRISESFFFENTNSKKHSTNQKTYSNIANQYVYILYNEILYQEYNTHIYKIGWTSRTPQIRADEISQGTGVVGKWKVGHQWKVEDGYWLEQRIFKHFSQYRLPYSEQFNFKGQTLEQVAKQISQFINNNGESPKRAAEIAEEQRKKEKRSSGKSLSRRT